MANPNLQPGPGRPKGSKDKVPRDLKTRVLAVWDQLATEEKDLLDEARKEPQWFYQNFVKPMLPKDVVLQGDKDAPLYVKVVREIIDHSTDKDG